MNIKELLETNQNLSVADYKALVEKFTGVTLPEEYEDFYTSPASTKYHGAKMHGLVRHSLLVYYFANKLAEAFGVEEINPIACIFHDLCKVGAYKFKNPTDWGQAIQYNKDHIIIQHGPESLRRLYHLGITLPEAWEFAVAYHMGAFLDKDAQTYSEACEKYPEVLLLHTADMMASHLCKEE